MGDNEKITKEKKEMKEELKSKELTEIIVGLLSFMILSGIFGYVGYKFCLDNHYDIQKGIVFGALFPMGLAILKELHLGNIFTYIAYTIIYIIVLDYVPTFVGIILLFLIISLFIIAFISTLKKDRTEEINKIYKAQHFEPTKKTTYTSFIQERPKTIHSNETFECDKMENEYECERCFRKISEEEFDLYDGMCEECFDETHYDFNGNPREDYWNY